MSRVKGADTKPELFVRSLVHRMGYRFRLHLKDLAGTPDIVLRRHGKVIFVHGCFWHGHLRCGRAARPTSNREFWNAKLSKNIERDRKNQKILKAEGWQVLVVWQCEIKNPEKLKSKLRKFLEVS